MPATASASGTCPRATRPTSTAKAGSRHISVPKAAVVRRRSASSSSANGTRGSRIARPTPSSSSSGVMRPNTLGPATTVAVIAATGIDRASPPIPATSSPTRWVSRMYAAQQQAAARAKATPTGSAAPLHGWVSSRTPTPASSGHRLPAAGPSAHDGDAERPEELQGGGSAERQPRHGRHEQHRDAGRDHAQRDAVLQRRPGELRGAGPDEHQDQHPGPEQPQPGGPVGSDAVDQAHGGGEPELHAEHRDHGHAGTGASLVVHAAQSNRPSPFAST